MSAPGRGWRPSLVTGGARNSDGHDFTASGRVVSGKDVVRTIHKAPAAGETLAPPVRLFTVKRLEAGWCRLDKRPAAR